MKQVVVNAFGGPEVLEVRQQATPEPSEGEVLVRLTSIGMNHAELMGRRGDYKLATGEPPFTPGLEGGGVIEAVGQGVDQGRVNQRVILAPDAPRQGGQASGSSGGGTYRSHYLVPANKALSAPDAIPDDQLGAIWLPYLTAWGCLVWKQQLTPGRIVALPAASSSVALAAAQIVKKLGGVAVGLTTRAEKLETLRTLETSVYDRILITHDADRRMKPWHRELRDLAAEHGSGGVDVFFDPVAAGPYLDSEIRCLAQGGVVWVYGLLGEPDRVDVSPLIRKSASIRGWMLTELIAAGHQAWRPGCQAILQGFANGEYRQHVEATFGLDDVQQAHEKMEKGEHVGKLVLTP